MVADGDRDGVLIGSHLDQHRFVFGVIDGVGDEVSQDAFDATRIHLGDDRFVGHVDE